MRDAHDTGGATFSIVTITYNAGDPLLRTLDSVLMQTYKNIDHIIVDGASTDSTMQRVESYVRRNGETATGHTVTVKSEPDKGIYDAMNKGLAMAGGDYVCFLNAGDSLPDSGTIAAIARAARLDDRPREEWPGVIYGDTDIVDRDGRFLHKRFLRPPKDLSWRSFANGMVVCHQAFYARVDLCKGIGYNLKYRFSADVDWCIRVMREAEGRHLQLFDAGETLACYMKEGQTTAHHKQSLAERFAIMAHHYGLLRTILMHVKFLARLNKP